MTEPTQPSGMPEAVIVRTEWSPFQPEHVVTMTQAGMGWKQENREDAHWVPWHLIGGLTDKIEGRTVATDVLALDGSSLGSIVGLFVVDGGSSTLAHVVASFRPDLFVEIEGNPWTKSSGCLRRDVADSDVGVVGAR
jgi:hypothetical protein